MANRVVIHAGTPKSGTTFLQSVLWTNRDRLRAAGVLVPGDRPYDHNRLGAAVRTRDPAQPRRQRHRELWRAFVDEAAAWPATVVLSNEWIVRADAAQLRRAVEDLRPAAVQVVLTARDPVSQVPAAWQESLKVGRSSPLGDFVQALDAGGQWSWRHLDPADVLDSWTDALPAGQCSVVTLPPRGTDPSVLWCRFAAVLGIDPDGCEVTTATANQSLSAEAAALLQQIGPSLRTAVDADDGGWLVQYRWIRQYVGHELLVPIAGRPIGLRDADVQRLRDRTRRSESRLAGGGYRICGDLADLSAATVSSRALHPDDVSDSAKLTVAVAIVPALLARVRQLARTTDRDDDGSAGGSDGLDG